MQTRTNRTTTSSAQARRFGAWAMLAAVAGTAALGQAGCATSSSSSSSASGSAADHSAQPMLMSRAPGRVVPPPSDDARVRDAAASELGPEAAATMPSVRAVDSAEAPAEPIDEGGAALVESIARSLSNRPRDARGVTVVSLSELRNYSRAGRGEFNDLLRRLARMLSRAGRDNQIEFVVDDRSVAGTADERPHYRMQGSAYLITADGFDQWELFLSITPKDWDMTVWDSRGAARVLRTARPGAQQITYPVPSGRAAP